MADETHSPKGVPLDGAEACRTGWTEGACPWPKRCSGPNYAKRLVWLADWEKARAEMEAEHLRGCEQAGKELGVATGKLLLQDYSSIEKRVLAYMGDFAPPVQPTELPPEIVAFHHWQDAKDAGFAPDGRHYLYGYLSAWWPGRDVQGLRGQKFARITISGRLAEKAHREPKAEAGHLVHVLRLCLRLEPRLWVEV